MKSGDFFNPEEDSDYMSAMMSKQLKQVIVLFNKYIVEMKRERIDENRIRSSSFVVVDVFY